MKKKSKRTTFRIEFRKWSKILFVNFVLIALFCASVLAQENSSQEKKITAKYSDKTILEVLEDLKIKTGYTFVHKQNDISNDVKITETFRNATLDEVLKKVLTVHGYDYSIEGKVIVIKKKERSQQSLTQEMIMIKGSVVDERGKSIPGVTILLKGTSLGGATDADGNFKIDIPKSQHTVLLFSFIGMKSQEVVYKGESFLKIVLEEDVAEIDEVVVTGIFSKSAESYTGAVSVVTEKELKSFGNRNILTTLRNIDPAFNILENNTYGSNPNKLPEIQIRGAANMPDIDQLQSSTNAELNTPLIIMDGFEISLQRMMDLDDNEVKSITLLKDASATAIYGSRGANGVVVIETKEPEAGRLKFTYTGSLNIEIPDLSDYDVLNAREKLDLELESGYYEDSHLETRLNLLERYSKILQEIERGVDTYWLSKPLRTGVGHRHNVKIEGGDKSFRYSASLQFNHVAGVMKESFRDNFNGGINLSYKTSNLLFRNSLTIGYNKSQESPYGSFSQYVGLNPYWTPTDENGNQKKFLEESPHWSSTNPANPLYNATLNSKNNSNYTDITNNFSIEWKPVQEFTLRGTFGFTSQSKSSDNYTPPEHTKFAAYTSEETAFRKGSYAYGTGKSLRYNFSLTANYSKVFAGKHMIFMGLNMDLDNNEQSNYNFSVEGFPSGSLDFLSIAMQYVKDGKPGGSESQSRRVGFVGNASYSYADRYFVDASFRSDGSSLYGADSRFAPFWSAGIGWNLHHENFMEDIAWIDRMKIRASVGQTGSNNFSAYEAMATYGYSLNDRYYQWMGASLKALANPNLQWQKTMKYDMGVELDLFNNRVRLIGDIYLERTNSLMSSLELPLSNGFTSYKANIGELENKGFELKATIFVLRDTERQLIWSVTGSLVHNKDKILKLSETMKASNERLLATGGTIPNRVWKEGESQNAIYVVQSLGIDPSTGKELFRKKNGEVTYTWSANDRVYAGLRLPKYRGNLNTTFRWRDLSVNLSFGYEWGGQEYNETLVNRVENADKKFNVDRRVYEERWMHAGDKTFFKGIKETTTTQATSRFVQDKTVFTCQNANIAYEFRDNKWLKRYVGLQNLTIRGNISDLFRISTIKQERGTAYPFSRQFSCSLSATF